MANKFSSQGQLQVIREVREENENTGDSGHFFDLVALPEWYVVNIIKLGCFGQIWFNFTQLVGEEQYTIIRDKIISLYVILVRKIFLNGWYNRSTPPKIQRWWFGCTAELHDTPISQIFQIFVYRTLKLLKLVSLK